MMSLASVLAFGLVASAHADAVCSRTRGTGQLKPWAPGRFFHWDCNGNPYATRMWYSITNPDGFKLTVTVTDGINDCNSNIVTQGAKTENSYVGLGFTNVTFFDGPCNQVPCCIKVSCERSNTANCTNVAVKYSFDNDLSNTDSHTSDEEPQEADAATA